MDSGSSIYRPPSAGLERETAPGDWGSIEGALEGDFRFEIGAIFSEAWQRTSGSKGVVLGGVAIIYAVSLGLGLVGGALQVAEPDSAVAVFASFALNVASALITYPLTAGLMLYGVHRSVSRPDAGFGDVFSCLPLALPLLALYIVQGLLTLLGLLLLILPGIYLAVAYSYAALLFVERRLGLWESLETSRKALTTCWFQYFTFLLLLALTNVVLGALTLGIGLIWTVPWSLLAYTIAYRNIFGVASLRPGAA